jgi:hypothetical protein
MSQPSNITYTIYRQSDGEIVESGLTTSEVQVKDGYSILTGVAADSSSFYVLNGELVEYNDEQKLAKANIKRNCYWSNDSFSWESKFSEQEKYNIQCNSVKAMRDTLLSESDWIVVRAMDTDIPIPTGWKEYRQILRDITSQSGYPFNVVWPVKPE